MIVYVKLENKETLPLEVNRSDSVAKLKMKIEEFKGIPKNCQRLTYTLGVPRDHQNIVTIELKDEMKFEDNDFFRVSEAVFLKLDGKMEKVLVKTLGSENLMNVGVNLSSTILDVKRKISQHKNIPMEFIEMQLGDGTMQVLYDHEFLSDNQIFKKILEYGLKMRIFGDVYIKTIAGEREQLEITPPKMMKVNIGALETFREVKEKIHEEYGFQVDGQRLYLFDEDLQKLEDKMVLNEFGLSEIVKHGLLLRYGFQNTLAQIFVKSMTGKIFTIKIKLSATVKDLKAKIEAKEGICPDQQRIHMTGTNSERFGRTDPSGQQLEDGRTLQCYNIRDKTMVDLFLRLTGS